MYAFVSFLFALARFEWLPNRIQLALMVDNPIIALAVVEPLLHFVTFKTVGLYYTKRVDNPIKGSVLYMLFYTVYTEIYCILSAFSFHWIAIVIVSVLYIAAHIGIGKLNRVMFGRGI